MMFCLRWAQVSLHLQGVCFAPVQELPPMQDLQISIGDDTELVQIGEVSGIVQVLGKCSYLKKTNKPQNMNKNESNLEI